MSVKPARALFILALTLAAFLDAAASRRTASVEAFAGGMFPFRGALGRAATTGFGVTWPLADNTRVGVHFIRSVLSSGGDPGGLLPGKLTLTPFLVFIRQDLRLGGRWAVHLSGGGGFVFATLREDVVTIPEVTISQRLPNSPALHLAARVSFALAESLSVFIQGGAVHCRTTGTTTVRDMNFGVSGSEFKANLGSAQGIAGLAFHL
jgi:hypothetical protein